MKFVIEDIGEDRVSLYEMNDDDLTIVPNIVLSRVEALSSYDICGEIINGQLKRFDTDEVEEYETTDDVLDYMGIEEDED